MWEHETPQQRFWKRLVRQRAESHMQNAKYLQLLRHRNDLAKADQKLFGHIWAEHNTNIYKLIAKSYGEVWDDEDEEKGGHLREKVAPMGVKKSNPRQHAFRVDFPCEERVRQGQVQGHVVQGRDDRREEDLQAQGRRRFGGGSSPQKAPP